jgi:hypothetical protein
MEDPWFQHVVAYLCSPEGAAGLRHIRVTETQAVAIAAAMVEHPGVRGTELVRLTGIVWGRVLRAMELFGIVSESWAPHAPGERDLSGLIVRAGQVALPGETGYKSREARTGKAWLRPVPESAYGDLRSPRTHEHWLSLFEAVLTSPVGDACRRMTHVSVRMAMKIATADIATSDYETGRNAARSHESLAALCDVSKSSVRRVRALMGALGLTALVSPGGHLSTDERERAMFDAGSRQIAVANNRAFVIPQNLQALQVEHLPSSPKGAKVSPVGRTLPKRTKVRSKAAPRPGSRQDQTRPATRPGSPRWTVEQQRLGAAIALFFGVPESIHVGHLTSAAVRLGLDPERWDARSIRDAVNAWSIRTGTPVRRAWEARRAVGYVAWVLGQATSAVAETQRERAARDAAEARERTARQRAAEALERERAASLSIDEFRRIRAASEAALGIVRTRHGRL